MKQFIKILFLILPILAMNLSCQKELSCESCYKKSNPPVANAGQDIKVNLPIDSVKLDGSASYDPDGTIIDFEWKKISGPVSFTISNNTSSIISVKGLLPGYYLFELKVTDNSGLSAKDTVAVTVDAVITFNHAPVANAGPDQSIMLPVNSVILNGNASFDPDNNIAAYQWSKISGPSSFNIANSGNIQTQVTNLLQGIYLFELKVTDSGGLFSLDTVQVTVTASPVAANYFPLTNGSYWNYFFSTNINIPDYAVHTVNNYSPVFGANTYSTIVEIWNPGTGNADDSFYYRRSGPDYYEYFDPGFDNPAAAEYIFLKDNVQAGTTWQSPNFSGTISGMPVVTHFKMTLLEFAVPAVVGLFNFPDVIKVEYEYFRSGQPLPLYTRECWFAKNIGLIKQVYSGTPYFNVSAYQVF